jgi:hypothetical protein
VINKNTIFNNLKKQNSMTMKIVLRLCLMMAVILSLHSCNTEEDYLNRTKDDHEPKKFSVFVSNGDEPLDYSKGFKGLMEKYDEINAEQHTLKALNHAWENKTEMSSEYVEFNIRSQDITVKENDLYIVFPLIKDNQIEGLVAAIVKNNKTWVEFIKINPEIETDYYQRVFTLFKMQYDKSIIQKKSLNKGAEGHCGFPGVPPCDIDEVIITLPNPDQPGSGWDGFPPGGVMASGECSKYQDCLHNDFLDGGGGGSENPADSTNTPITPCAKIKSMVSKPQIKDSLNSLKLHAQTGSKTERGFQELKSGTIQAGSTTAGNEIFFGIGPNSLGTVHTHQPGTVGILAPQDIMTFLHIVREQDANILGNAYSGTVSSTGTYFVNFIGTASDLPPAMTEAQEAAYVVKLVEYYEKNYYQLLREEGKKHYQTLSNTGLEKLFFNTLNKIGLLGKVSLIKEDNVNTSTIEKDSNGNPVPNPC